MVYFRSHLGPITTYCMIYFKSHNNIQCRPLSFGWWFPSYLYCKCFVYLRIWYHLWELLLRNSYCCLECIIEFFWKYFLPSLRDSLKIGHFDWWYWGCCIFYHEQKKGKILFHPEFRSEFLLFDACHRRYNLIYLHHPIFLLINFWKITGHATGCN